MIKSILLCFATALSYGCTSTLSLDRMVLSYDKSTTDSVSKQLLLNIARAQRSQPIHFTSVSSITATYRFAVNAGVGGAVTGDRGGLLVPLIGASAEENPTISILPMQGDEFTQRLLTPFSDQKLTLLLRQGYDVDSLLRLMGGELLLDEKDPSKTRVLHNRPSDIEGYTTFRRVMAHLSSIQDRHALHVEPLYFQRSWTVPSNAVTPESFLSVYKDFSLKELTEKNAYVVSKQINGRVLITNFDPLRLQNDERLKLHAAAEEAPINEILIDIRKGYPGGEYPLQGRLRLRSFHEILTFLGRNMQEEPEFEVLPDPRSPDIKENPVNTLKIAETDSLPMGTDIAIAHERKFYSVQDQPGYQWNKKAFSLLYQLFQMTVLPTAQAGPAITIAK